MDPGDLGQRLTHSAITGAGGAEVHGAGAPLLSLEHVEADVGGDLIEPRAQLRAAFEAIEVAPGSDQRLLDGVLGLEAGPEHAVAVGGQLGAVSLELPLWRLLLDN